MEEKGTAFAALGVAGELAGAEHEIGMPGHGHFPAEDVRKLAWENASTLFKHPVPAAVQADPEAF